MHLPASRYVPAAVRVEPLTLPLPKPNEAVATDGLGARVDAGGPASATRAVDVIRDLVSLAKPRLSSMVLFTAAGGLGLAPGHHSTLLWVTTLLGTAGTVASANALNCIAERESDRAMARTARRPLATGRLSVRAATLFAMLTGVPSLALLAWLVNPLTAGLGALALVSYAFVYTPLKSRSAWAMHVGALPGALPPLMGWTAATGRIEAPGLALFSLLFVWQLPHFLAIALFRRDEYQRAGLRNVPLERGDRAAWGEAIAYTALLIPVALSPVWVGVGGPLAAVAAVGLGLFFLWVAISGWRSPSPEAAFRLFRVSLAYLGGVFVALAISVTAGV